MVRPAPAAASSRRGGLSARLCLLGTVLGLLAVVLLPAPALAVRVVPQRPPPQPGLPWLEVSGSRITTTSGDTVILRGFNVDSLLQTGSAPLPPPLTSHDALLMEQQGFDVVRLPISWSLLEPRPGDFSQTYLARLQATVARCARHHLYVVLDMHTEDFGVAYGGSGAPAWLGVPGVPDLHLPGLSAAWQRHLSPAVNAALAFFWLYPNWQRLYWQAWTVVARRFEDDSAVAGYDLYNEPHPLPIPPGIFATRLLWPFYADGIRTIARVDPNHLFILEGDLFGEFPTAIRPLHAADVVYSTHLYAGSILGAPFTGRTRPLRQEWDQALSEAGQLPAPYWVGELGIQHSLPRAQLWAQDQIALSNRHLAGWAWWQWDDPDGWGVRQGSGPVDEAWLDVLSEPFVRFAPGDLVAMSYSPKSGILDAKIADAVPGSSVLVSWPRSEGPVRLESRCVRLSPGALSPAGQLRLLMLTPTCQIRLAG
jgi:endoglycosylceramidase